MHEDSSTVWPADPHTLAKHQILRTYLQAWFPILSNAVASQRGPQREILYVDGFAGPGIYEGGEPGSPIIAVQTAREHSHPLPAPVRFLFIERDPPRFESLKRELGKLPPHPNVRILEPELGDCNEILTKKLDRMGQRSHYFGPALVFLDQFGYSGVPMELIARLMKLPRCEVFVLLNYKRMQPYVTDRNKASPLTRAFGTDAWVAARKVAGLQRRDVLLASYKAALREYGRAPHVLDFAMCDQYGNLIYWLFFCTGHRKGIEQMKRAMRRVDDHGTYRFSDKDARGQLALLEKFDDEWLAEELARRLAGRTLSVREVEEYVLDETPCYSYKRALTRLERVGRLEMLSPRPGRRRGSFTNPNDKVRLSDAT